MCVCVCVYVCMWQLWLARAIWPAGLTPQLRVAGLTPIPRVGRHAGREFTPSVVAAAALHLLPRRGVYAVPAMHFRQQWGCHLPLRHCLRPSSRQPNRYRYKKINRSHTHTHTHTDREHHPRHRNTRIRQEQHTKPPKRTPPTGIDLMKDTGGPFTASFDKVQTLILI